MSSANRRATVARGAIPALPCSVFLTAIAESVTHVQLRMKERGITRGVTCPRYFDPNVATNDCRARAMSRRDRLPHGARPRTSGPHSGNPVLGGHPEPRHPPPVMRDRRGAEVWGDERLYRDSGGLPGKSSVHPRRRQG